MPGRLTIATSARTATNTPPVRASPASMVAASTPGNAAASNTPRSPKPSRVATRRVRMSLLSPSSAPQAPWLMVATE